MKDISFTPIEFFAGIFFTVLISGCIGKLDGQRQVHQAITQVKLEKMEQEMPTIVFDDEARQADLLAIEKGNTPTWSHVGVRLRHQYRKYQPGQRDPLDNFRDIWGGHWRRTMPGKHRSACPDEIWFTEFPNVDPDRKVEEAWEGWIVSYMPKNR